MTPIYHITHVRNLPSILEQGGLYATSALAQRQVDHVNIAHRNIQDRRATTPVPVPPGGVLHDYVPFYFAPRSPMLYAIHRGSVRGYTEGQAPIVHLVSSTEVVAQHQRPFTFTDGHAIMAITHFYNDLRHLTQLDWTILRATFWADTLDDNDRTRRRNAEFLVQHFVPWDLIQGIGVMYQDTARTVAQILADYAPAPDIKIHKDWYYW